MNSGLEWAQDSKPHSNLANELHEKSDSNAACRGKKIIFTRRVHKFPWVGKSRE